MRVWLDDVRPMPEGFDKHVVDYVSAINALRTGKVTFMSFDHDLAPEHYAGYVASGGGTGYDVARWVEEQAYYGNLPRFKWAVHSANPQGRLRIQAALRKADMFWDRRK